MTRRRPIQAGIHAHPEGGDPGGGAPPAALREAYSHWATGVAILAVRQQTRVEAITVAAFSPLSLEPPLVLCCLSEQAAVLPMLTEERRFTVSVLAAGERRAAGIAADPVLAHTLPFQKEGDPVLAGALVAFVCHLTEEYPGGDHRVLIAEVERLVIGPDAGPLLYFRREYGALQGYAGRRHEADGSQGGS